jgi:hypothetical protein
VPSSGGFERRFEKGRKGERENPQVARPGYLFVDYVGVMKRLGIMIKNILVSVGLLVLGWLVHTTAMAHHSAAAFDPNILVDVTGTVKELAWTSPHARLYVDVEQADGTIVTWNFELPSPVGLMRKGWRRDALKPGDTVSVEGFRAKEFPDIGIADLVRDGAGNPIFSGR